MPVLVFPFLGATLAAQNPPAPQSQPAPATTHTLEELYKLARERSDRSTSESMGPVNALISMLELPYDSAPERVESTITEILKFKDVATRALIRGLRAPASTPRGSNCARALAKSTDPALVSDLEIELNNNPPAETRARIAWVLGRHPGERTGAVLQKLLGEADSEVVSNAALAAGQLKIKELAPTVAEKLEKAPASLARTLLVALGDLEEPRTLPQILAFLETPVAAECVASLGTLVKSMRAHELLAPSLRALLKWKSTSEDNLKLMQAVAGIVASTDRDALLLLKKVLTEVPASREVQEEAAYALHFAKDPAAKNFLLQDINDRLKENPDGEKLIRKRARIYLKLKLYRESVRDFEDIRRLAKSKQNNITIDGDLWVDMARAYAGAKNLGSAADCLRNAIAFGMKSRVFRDHEEFTDMKKQAKYTPLFENND